MLRIGHLSRLPPRSLARALVNAAVTLGLAYALYRQFFVANDLVALWGGFRQNLPAGAPLYLAAVAGLMPANLLLEAYKLRVALPQNLRAGWRDTLGQVCAGIAVGLWTPGRLGEFAGRLARTRAAQRGPVIAATALGGIAQWTPLLLGGGLGVLLWRGLVPAGSGPPDAAAGAATAGVAAADYLRSGLVRWLAAGSAALGLLVGLLFFYVADALAWLRRARWPTSVLRPAWRAYLGRALPVAALEAFRGERVGLFSASVARYGVYVLQMGLAFVAFGLGVDVGAAILGTAALLLLHGFLPVPPALQAVARIEFALLLFAYSDPNEVAIAAASLFVFALNLGLPALVGWLFIVRRHDVSHSP